MCFFKKMLSQHLALYAKHDAFQGKFKEWKKKT